MKWINMLASAVTAILYLINFPLRFILSALEAITEIRDGYFFKSKDLNNMIKGLLLLPFSLVLLYIIYTLSFNNIPLDEFNVWEWLAGQYGD